MKYKEWIYLARLMWSYANEREDSRVSPLLKQLVREINTNSEVMIDDMDKFSKINASNLPRDTHQASKLDFNGNGEY